MAILTAREAASAPLNSTAIIAIVTSVGVVILCGITIPIVLLVRARRNHRRLIADLETRGVFIAQAQKEARETIGKPRNVLRRNTVLPFDGNNGWGALQSVETLRSMHAPSTVAHYVPPKPEGAKRTSRLSWPFSSKRISGHSVKMQKLRGSRLSTVMEDPKPSSMVPVLGNNHHNASRSSFGTLNDDFSGMSSCQSLLRHHPAFRSSEQMDDPHHGNQAYDRTYFRSDANKRLVRARSVAAVPTAPVVRPHLRARSASSSGKVSGNAPDVILPPLPTDIARIKSEERMRGNLRHVQSKCSVSSVESADTSILASRLSPIIPQATKVRAQKITKPTWKSNQSSGARPFRDTLDLRAQVLNSQGQMQQNASRSMSTPHIDAHKGQAEHRNSLPVDLSAQDLNIVKTAKATSSNTGQNVNSSSPVTQNSSKRRSRTYVSAAGSPERQAQSGSGARNLASAVRSPKRQHSQTSSRSSGGNPFQWDPTPLSPAMKPSALKGSPSARQGHRRKNSVRISLVPTFHGPPSRGPSESLLVDTPEKATEGGAKTESASNAGGIADTAKCPAPPSSTTFAPDLKIQTTSIRASLTSTSPTLPLVSFDQSFVVFPTDQVLPELSAQERKRLSTGSIFSLSHFPATPSIIEPTEFDIPQSTTTTTNSSNNGNAEFKIPDTPYLTQQPFRSETPEQRSPSPDLTIIDLDAYDPERPNMIFQTPVKTGSRPFQSAFDTIPEESSVASVKTLNMEATQDSPSISPRSSGPPKFDFGDQSSYNVPIHSTIIQEEPPETIDPSVLSKDSSFNILNSSFHGDNSSVAPTPTGSQYNFQNILSTTPGSAQMMLEPLLDAAFPSSPPTMGTSESPVLGHMRNTSQASSVYSSHSPSPAGMSPNPSAMELPSPVFPCSPRPSHAQLPNQSLSINFAEMPKLNPSPRGPRGSPPRPLRSSIAALRRMNSDAADAKKSKAGRGERRYLRIGREDSVQLPGEESWLDEMEDEEAPIEVDEEEGRRLVGNCLDDSFDEGCTILALDEGTTLDSISTIKPTTSSSPSPSPSKHTSLPTDQRSSSIWEDNDIFWTSNTPPQSTTQPRRQSKSRYKPLPSSPLITTNLSDTSTTATTTRKDPSTPPRKRKSTFRVAQDITTPPPSLPLSPTENSPTSASKKRKEHSRRTSSTSTTAGGAAGAGSRYRRRNVLGVGTPNVRIQVTTPGGSVFGALGGVQGGGWTPGSLYDAQGFLRY